MEKIQHNINSLSLIFFGFFAVEVMITAMLFAMKPFYEPFELMKLLGFLVMIPVSIMLLRLAGKYKTVSLLWLSILIFLLHYALLLLI